MGGTRLTRAQEGGEGGKGGVRESLLEKDGDTVGRDARDEQLWNMEGVGWRPTQTEGVSRHSAVL